MKAAQPAVHGRPDAASPGQDIIQPGTPAPAFTLRRGDGSPFTREDLLGRTTVLVFYPNAFSPVCSDQFTLYEEVVDELRAQGATPYGVSCDQRWSQQAFSVRLDVSI